MNSALRAALLTTALSSVAHAREFTVVAYNVENLFDADKVAIFDDYAETGEANAYSPAKLVRKMEGIARVLRTFNNGAGPDIIALNELELDFTPDSKVTNYAAFLEKYKDTTVETMLTSDLNDEIRGLPSEALLLKYLGDQGMKGYHVAIGADAPDFAAMATTDRAVHKKGHKNGLLSKFPIKAVKSHPTPDARDVLEVELEVEGHPLTIFVNHWKSGASALDSEQTRRFNAKTLRERLDAIFAADPSADVIVTGDFNSQYNQSQAYPQMGKTGINDVLGSQGDEMATASATNYSLYNLWHELPADQRRSDHYDGTWGTLMQAMITPGLYDHSGVQYIDNSFTPVALQGVNAVTQLNLPRRWSNFGGGSGFSDHFPVTFRARIVSDNDNAKRLELSDPGTPAKDYTALAVGFDRLKASELPVFNAKIAAQFDKHTGEFFRVKGAISSRRPLTIKVGHKEYALWSSDRNSKALLPLRKLPKASTVDLIGMLSFHKGKPQFLVEDPSWVIGYKAAEEKAE